MVGPRSGRWLQILGAQVIRPPHAKGQAGRWIAHFLAGGMVVGGAALLASWIHVQNITLRYRYSQAYRVQQQRVLARHALEIERQMLRRPERIVRIAQEELGMRMPSVEERVILK